MKYRPLMLGLVVAITLTACRATIDCTDPGAIWQAGSNGEQALLKTCDDRSQAQETVEALTLSQQHYEYSAQLTTLKQQLPHAGQDERGKLTLEQVRLQRELQQIEGIARLRGWLPNPNEGS